MPKEPIAHVPMRTCIVTREKLPKKNLVRFVLDKVTGEVTLDLSGGKNGRGANMKMDLFVFDEGVKKGSLNRAFKRKVLPNNLSKLRAELSSYIELKQNNNTEKVKNVRIKGDNISL